MATTTSVLFGSSTMARRPIIQISQAAKNREAPVLVVIGPDGKQEMVNYRVKDDMYIVDRLFETCRTDSWQRQEGAESGDRRERKS